MSSRYNEVAKRFGLPPANCAMGADVAGAADLEARVTFLEAELDVQPETKRETADVVEPKEGEEEEDEPETPATAETGDKEGAK